MRSVLSALVGSVGCALVPHADAAVQVFENDGSFVWIAHLPEIGKPGNGLDITQPASQAGDLTPNAFTWRPPTPDTSLEVAPATIDGGPLAQIARGDEVTVIGEQGLEYMFTPPVAFPAGGTVGPGETFGSSATMWAFGFAIGDQLLIGEQATVGVRVDLGDGFHYGWIDLLWNGSNYQPQAWAYETEAGVPITVPSPSGALLIVGGGLVACRRRRSAG